MKLNPILICACISVSVFSCKKDSGNSSQAFEDTWNFTGLHSETTAVVITTEGGQTGEDSTVSIYDTKNNAGTIKFDGSSGSAISTGLGYIVPISSLDYNYLNGALMDTSLFSISDTVLPSNYTRGYILVGKDSVTFTGAGLVSDPENTYTVSGAHYTIVGNNMTLSTLIEKDSSGSDNMIGYSLREMSDVKIYLQKN